MRWLQCRSPRRPVAACPLQLESLEARQVLSVSLHGGAVLPHVGVEAEFLGQYWTTAAGQQQAANLNSFLGDVVNSSYMDLLNQYGVGRGRLVDLGQVNPTAGNSSTIDDTAIRSLLDQAIQRGGLQAPAGKLYVVFTAPNVVVTQGSEDSAHDFYGYHDTFTDAAGDPVYYAVIANPVGNGDFYNLNDFQTVTKVVSHELAEAVTDPDVSTGWFDANGEEVGDLANGPTDVGLLHGYVVQAEWSNVDHGAVLPTGTTQFDARTSIDQQVSPGARLGRVAYAFTTSDEFFANLVQGDYQQYLGRTASAGEVANWVGVLKLGVTDEQLLAGIVASAEYYRRAGGTDQAWFDALYRDVLGRTADAVGEGSWLNALAQGMKRGDAAYAFAASAEHEALVVANDYQHYLGRTASATEVGGWVAAFQRGATDEQIVAGFLASTEFYRAHGSATETWLTAVYEVALGRAPDAAGYNQWLLSV